VRNALILLLAVAALILIAGGVNHGVAFDVDYVAGTVKAVSLFWVAAIVAALVFVVGAVAAWLAQSATVTRRRKLEAELQSTYERLREAEALAARAVRAVAPATPVAADAAEQTAVASGQTVVTTVVAAGTADAASAVDADETVVDVAAAEGEPEEITAAGSTSVTAVSAAAADDASNGEPSA